MATTTPNYSLRKPAATDNVNVALDISGNMDLLDAHAHSGTYVPLARGVVYAGTAGEDRSVSNPGVLQFSPHFVPAAEEGDHYGVMCRWDGSKYVIQSTPAKGNVSRVFFREPIFSIGGDNVYDPFLLRLPSGNLILGFHSGDAGDIHFYRSTDGGANWASRAVLDAGDPFVTRRRFSEVQMVRVTSGNPWTGTPNRIVAAWADIDPILPKSRDSYVVTAYSNDEGATWSTPVRVTPASGSTSAGLLDDNQRPWLFEDGAALMNLIYTRVEVVSGTAVASIWHTQLDSVGATVTAAPVKVADAPLAKSSGSLSSGSKNGCSPAVFVARDGYYRLVWAEADYGNGGSTGELHIMSGDGGPAGWANHAVLVHRTDCPNGYGRITPHRIAGAMELFHVRTLSASATDIRSLTMPGL